VANTGKQKNYNRFQARENMKPAIALKRAPGDKGGKTMKTIT